MSMNIYSAWRFKQEEMESVLRLAYSSIRPSVEDAVVAAMKTVLDIPCNTISGPIELIRKTYEFSNEVNNSPGNWVYSPECYLGIWLHEGYAYMRPFGHHSFYDFDKLLSTRRIKTTTYQSYAYWNSSDKPDHIRNKEWDQREKTWNEIDDGYPTIPCIIHFLCEINNTFFTRNFHRWFDYGKTAEERTRRAPKRHRKFLIEADAKMLANHNSLNSEST